MQNANGLTLPRWTLAAGFDRKTKIPKEAVTDWHNGVDPAEWHAKTFLADHLIVNIVR